MVTKSKLKLALAFEKGMDFKSIRQAKKQKDALKRKRAAQAGYKTENNGCKFSDLDSASDDGSQIPDGDNYQSLNFNAVDESDTSDSSVGREDPIPRRLAGDSGSLEKMEKYEDCGENGEEDNEEDIPISDIEDLEDEVKEDLVPYTRLTINNTSALLVALDRISIPTGKDTPFATHQSIVADSETAESIPDLTDDLQRELAFYSQCATAAFQGRAKLIAEGVSFSRPKDYFAEMVKEDEHMQKVKAKLVDEASTKKASAEARKLRELKKFGKQVQVAKLQERQKAKRETLDKIKTLKRKRQESNVDLGTKEEDLFDVGVNNEISKHTQRLAGGRTQRGTPIPNTKRQKKNERYGFGGKKKNAKSGDAISSGDLSGFNARKMKTGVKSKAKVLRLGKSKRRNSTSK